MQYPVTLSFKKIALAPQVFVRDASGADVAYVKQKLFKLKEQIEVFTNRTKNQLLYTIKANRVLDFSAGYLFADAQGNALGAVRRKGARSLWRAYYEIVHDIAGEPDMVIREENGWIKVLDAMLGDVPIIGFIFSYMLNPSYLITKNGQPFVRIKKQPAFFEGEFKVEALAPIEPQEEPRLILSVLMMLLLERSRG